MNKHCYKQGVLLVDWDKIDPPMFVDGQPVYRLSKLDSAFEAFRAKSQRTRLMRMRDWLLRRE